MIQYDSKQKILKHINKLNKWKKHNIDLHLSQTQIPPIHIPSSSDRYGYHPIRLPVLIVRIPMRSHI